MSERIKIIDVVGTPLCVAVEDGQKVYIAIHDNIASSKIVELSFAGVTRLTTLFLNVAVGQLYNEFSDEHVREHLKIADADQRALALLKLVVDGAKQFFAKNKN